MAMGFTVPAIAVDAALPGGAMQEAARMGLALSLAGGRWRRCLLAAPRRS